MSFLPLHLKSDLFKGTQGTCTVDRAQNSFVWLEVSFQKNHLGCVAGLLESLFSQCKPKSKLHIHK